MKKYLGVKIIEAEPMSEIDFLQQVKKEPIEEGRGNREGYKVVYPDGYVSWSPKDVFEKAYKKMFTDEGVLRISVDAETGSWAMGGIMSDSKIKIESDNKNKYGRSDSELREICMEQAIRTGGVVGMNQAVNAAEKYYNWIKKGKNG